MQTEEVPTQELHYIMQGLNEQILMFTWHLYCLSHKAVFVHMYSYVMYVCHLFSRPLSLVYKHSTIIYTTVYTNLCTLTSRKWLYNN